MKVLKENKNIGIAFASIIILSGCASKQELLLFNDLDANNTQVDSSEVLATETLTGTSHPYIIKPYDRLSIKIYGAFENDSNQMPENGALVDEKGYVIVPIAGKVKVANLTESEASAKIQKKIRKTIVDAIVAVEVPNKTVYVLGDVKKPGPVKLTNGGEMPLLSAIGAAGGFMDTGAKNAIYVVRKEGSKAGLVKLSLSGQNSLTNSFKMLKPGDIVYVAPNSAKVTSMSKLEVLRAIGTGLTPITTAKALAD